MINLYRYLNDIFENNAVKITLIQELLSCVFFDAWFNMKNKFDKTEDIYKYYKENLTLIQNICAVSKSRLNIKDFDDFMNQTKKSKDWQKSFIFQCKSFENWIENHPSFNHELTFVHHDTSIGIFKTSVSTGWLIAERVNNGTKKFGYKKKDLYQKADIYAVVNKTVNTPDEIDNIPEKDIESEVVYWRNALLNNGEDEFVGISLKKLSKSISNVHTFGLDKSVEAIEDRSVKFEINTFNNIIFNPSAGVITPGVITTYIHFNVNSSEEDKSEYDIFVKSNGKGVEHAKKDPWLSYIAPVTTELKKKNSSAQAGKAQSLINDWLEENNDIDKDVLKSNNCKGKGSEEFLNIHRYICDVLNKEKISSCSFNFTPQAIQLLEFLKNNYEKIDEVYKTFKDKKEDEESVLSKIKEIPGLKEIDKIKSFEEIMVMLYNITKWYNVSWKILNVYYIIAKQIEKNGLNKTILDIYNYCKGVNSNDKDLNLPYVLIGQ